MGKAEENKKAKREALLNTAFELFTSQGFPATSIANIAEQAGVAKGTFYLYFKDKYDLRDRLIRHKASQILGTAFDAMSKTASKTIEDKILFLAANITSQLSDDKTILRFIGKNLSWGVIKHSMESMPPIGDEAGEESFAEAVQHMFETSEVRYKNPEILLYMIVEFVGATCYSSVLENEPVPITELRPYIIESVRAIMRSQEIVQN